MTNLSERIFHLAQDIVATSCLAPVQRIANYLLSASTSTQAVIELPVYKLVIASRLAMTPEAFSRALRDFRFADHCRAGEAFAHPRPGSAHGFGSVGPIQVPSRQRRLL